MKGGVMRARRCPECGLPLGPAPTHPVWTRHHVACGNDVQRRWNNGGVVARVDAWLSAANPWAIAGVLWLIVLSVALAVWRLSR